MAVAPLLALIFLAMSHISWAAGPVAADTREADRLNVTMGKSIIFESDKTVKRVSIGDPGVADFVLISPHELYITGKAPGLTNLTLWYDKGGFRIFDVEVAFDIARLKRKLNEILPGESDIRVIAMDDSLTLSGRVSNAANLSQVLSLAGSHAPEGKVNNLLEVGGVQQVMLEVRVAEMQRSLGRRLGVNFNYISESGKFGIDKLGDLTSLDDDKNLTAGSAFDILVSQTVNAIFRFTSNGATWTTFIDALKANGLVKVLAEPTLIALSGNEAFFLAGGEFPVPVPQGLGTVAIEYKDFGVGLAFTPTVLSNKKINLKVSPEVSELDFSVAAQIEGFVVPGLTTRKAATVIELADGQSFAIAGLLRDTTRDFVSKFPFLGDIPILGQLFTSREFQRNETELVIIVTPHLVKPLDIAGQPLPTDFYNSPNDAEFYILGMMEGSDRGRPESVMGDLEGEFGHAIPGRN